MQTTYLELKPWFLTKRDQQTQTECLQPPASSLASIVSDPDYFKVIKSLLSIQSMRTLSSSSTSLWKEIRPILMKSKQIKEILKTKLPYGYKEKLKGFNWTVGSTLETDILHPVKK